MRPVVTPPSAPRGAMPPLDVDPSIVERILPHRRPFLFVDRVTHYRGGPRPELRATRAIDAADPILAGHFPGAPIWPGVLTIEGMGQASALLATIAAVDAAEPDRARDDLVARLAHVGLLPLVGLGAAVDVKLTAPVAGGDTLTYEVELTHRMDALARFEVRARVGGREVARGSMTGVFRGLDDISARGGR